MRHFSKLVLTIGFAIAFMLIALFGLIDPVKAQITAKDLLKQGVIAIQNENYQKAISDFTQAIALENGFVAAYSNRCLAHIQSVTMGDGWFDRSLSSHSRDELEAAVADCTEAIRLQPNNTEAYLNRGLAYLRLGNFSLAIADHSQILTLEPTELRAYYNRGLVYIELGDYKQAIADYNQALLHTRESTAQAIIYSDRGLAYMLQNQMPEAIANFNQSIQLNSQDARAYYNRGCAYQHQSLYAQALPDFNQALRLDSHNSEAYLARGISKYHLGLYAEAQSDLQTAAQNFSDSGQMTRYKQAILMLHEVQQWAAMAFA